MEGKYKVLITASGTGSRLGEITKKLNKALVEIDGVPAIQHIIDSYPEGAEIVITVGYLKEQLREEVAKLYPNRKITLVEVDNFEGKGSSLGYSMLCAEDELQCPFVFHCCDTLVPDKIPLPDHNWVAGYKIEDSTQYTTHNVDKDGRLISINKKGAKEFDYAHIGLVGIRDHQSYWESLQKVYEEDPFDETLNDIVAINDMLKKGDEFREFVVSEWFDTGNPEALKRTVNNFAK